MKTNYFYLFCCLSLIFCTTACKKYEARYDGAWTDEKATPGLQLHVIRNIAYAMPDGIWTTDGINAPKHALTDNEGTIKRVSISPNYDKIAFLKTTGSITVIDSNGTILNTNANPANIQHFEWHSNNNLLYGTQNTPTDKNIVALYGNELPTGLPMPTLSNSAESLLFTYITLENDIIYSTRLANTYSRLYYKKNGSTTATLRTDYVNYNGAPTNIRITNNNTNAYLFNTPTTYWSNIEIQSRAFRYLSSNAQNNIRIYFNTYEYIDDYLGLKYYTKADGKCPDGCLIAYTKIFDIK